MGSTTCTTEKIPMVAIVIANYNGAKYIGDCLESLFSCNYSNYIVVVVDDCSTDESISLIKQSFSQVYILRTVTNAGYAHANNIGIQFGLDFGADYILLLNSDTVVERSFLTQLVINSDMNTITVPYLFDYKHNKKLQSAGGCILWNKGKTKGIGEGVTVKEIYDITPKKINFASGCCLLINKNIISKIGFLREDFYMYFEDTDYSIKALKNKVNIKVVPSSKIYHKQSLSMGGNKSPKKQYYLLRNRLYLVSENKKLFSKDIYLQILIDVLELVGESKNMKKYLFLAFVDFLLNRRGKMKY